MRSPGLWKQPGLFAFLEGWSVRQPRALAVGIKTALLLKAADDKDVIHFLSDQLTVDAGNRKSVVTVARTGRFYDPRYGDFELTQQMFSDIIRNFNDGVYGQKIFYDVAHKPEDGNAGEITRLFIDRNKLRAEVEWTQFGQEAILDRGFVYSSAEIHPDYQSNEYDGNDERQRFGATLLGAGLVTRPCIKNLDKIELSESSLHDCATYISDSLARKLLEESTVEKYIKMLKQRLAAIKKLTEQQASQIIAMAEQALENEKDETRAKAFVEKLEDTAKSLSESGNQGPVSFSLNQTGLDEAGVKKLFQQLQDEQAKTAKQQKEALDARVKQFNEAIDKAEGLDDSVRTELKKTAELISADMSEAQVTKLAEQQITLGNSMVSQDQLMQLGFTGTPAGAVQGQADKTGALKLADTIQTGLRNTNEYVTGQLKILAEDKLPPFCKRVLSEFDRQNAAGLQQEAMLFSGNNNTMSNVDLPLGVQREVIREALSDLRILELVQTLTDFQAQATTQIPYEQRNAGGIPNQGIVYENQGIHKVSVSQKMELAYVLPMKIAFELSNELIHFSKVSNINWDAWGRNVASAARVMRELITVRIANEIQRVSDSHMAADVSNESVASQLASGPATFKLAQFPLVREHQQYDLQGNTVGNKENPITLMLDGSEVKPFDGTGEQAPGSYYVVSNFNQGLLAIVDETGAVKSDLAPSTAIISYSYATNIVKVDSDVPDGLSEEKHLNKLLRAVGRRKAIMKDDRFVSPDFLMMSNTLNDTCTNAEEFVSTLKRNGTDTTVTGDLESIKSLPAFSTNTPGIHLGDERIQMGMRNALTYTICKPFALSEVQEARDSNGQLKGGKEVYGEEYNCIHSPKAIRNRFTAVLFYSQSQRDAL
ncbi:hypothetical protein HMF8227_02367 [Saliniradius amylolyticus]|uniref:Uncharacterized protein n=1 Tax=Saliniradius amylolyticus TaxID=2183582 RepID=A0A2S2E5E7_9ALTE|nr:hypothetical protein [Saliniradius amylolyticus]AWL12819.1 hypothetical protein HMF8227_02367 [Saliniradius amylolyticus]